MIQMETTQQICKLRPKGAKMHIGTNSLYLPMVELQIKDEAKRKEHIKIISNKTETKDTVELF